MSYTIVALGNPGEEYELTRHNTGRIVLEEALKKEKLEWKVDKKFQSRVAKTEIAGEKVLLLEPETFMNKSGVAVKALNLKPKAMEKLIVVHDDLDIPIGSFKISFNKSAGGHRGVESIVKALKSEAFVRVRIGISPVTASGKLRKPLGDAVEKCILGVFKPVEQKTIKNLSKDVGEVFELIVSGKRGEAMNRFNA